MAYTQVDTINFLLVRRQNMIFDIYFDIYDVQAWISVAITYQAKLLLFFVLINRK